MTRRRLHILVLAFTLAGYGWTAWNALAPHGEMTICPVKLATGLPCPSCGTTRAVTALARGELAAAAAANPFGLLIALGAILIPPWVAYDTLRSRDGFHRFYLATERALARSRPLAIACVALVLANWGWNILKGF